FGFLGVVVYTLVHTPRRCGHESKAADLLLLVGFTLPFLTNCDIVGILDPLYCLILLVLQLFSDLRDGKDKDLILSRNHFNSNYFAASGGFYTLSKSDIFQLRQNERSGIMKHGQNYTLSAFQPGYAQKKHRSYAVLKKKFVFKQISFL